MATQFLPAATIDGGFGFFKFSKLGKASRTINGKLVDVQNFGRIPSIAVRSTGANMESGLSSADVVLVRLPEDLGGGQFTVGPDGAMFETGEGKTGRTSQFYLSPEYFALHYGALAYMGFTDHTQIDVLVVGLPPGPKLFGDRALRAKIAKQLTRTYSVPLPGRQKSINVEVSNVLVVPQGHGSLLYLSRFYPPYGESGLRYLTLDSGYGTFIGYVTNGERPVLEACTFRMSGANSLLRKIANALDPQMRDVLQFRQQIDQCLRRAERAFEFGGTHYVISPSVEDVWHSEAKNFLQAIIESCGDIRTFSRVGLTGGSAFLYEKAVSDVVPEPRLVIQREEAGLAQIYGYLDVAEAKARALSAKRCATWPLAALTESESACPSVRTNRPTPCCSAQTPTPKHGLSRLPS